MPSNRFRIRFKPLLVDKHMEFDDKQPNDSCVSKSNFPIWTCSRTVECRRNLWTVFQRDDSHHASLWKRFSSFIVAGTHHVRDIIGLITNPKQNNGPAFDLFIARAVKRCLSYSPLKLNALLAEAARGESAQVHIGIPYPDCFWKLSFETSSIQLTHRMELVPSNGASLYSNFINHQLNQP